VFAVLPGLEAGSLKTALLRAALSGLIADATYNLTNLATLKDWVVVLTVVDLAWGTALSVAVSLAGYLAGKWQSWHRRRIRLSAKTGVFRMAQPSIHVDVRSPTQGIGILEVQGELTGSAEEALLAAHGTAGSEATAILLNLSGVHAIDSLGAGLLITLLAHVRKKGQRLLAYGVSDACRRAFELTHLDEVVGVYPDETMALGSLQYADDERASGGRTARPQAIQTAETPRGRWAEPVDRLSLPPLPRGAIRAGTEGRRPTGPVKGFGSLWRRTYAIHLVGSAVTPSEVVQVWKERFGSFWPPAGRFYGAETPIEAGDVALLNLAGPAGLIIATAILVIYADDKSFCFISAEGHMFGGMITFSAHQDNGATVAHVHALLRASDPLFEIAVRLGIVTKPEDQFWQGVLKNLAAYFGVEGQPVRQRAVLLDRSLQWPEAKKIWYNGVIRSALHTPVRLLRGQGTR
jgi:anti-anti-sigma factor